jgi:cytochrome oxidase Cu insertion factor (SCO1/SenC/PrrC family)
MAANDPSVARRKLLIRIRWLLWGAVFLLAVAAAVIYGTHRRAAPKAAAVAAIDAPAVTWAAGVRRAPDFRLTDQHGRPVSLAGLRGRPVLVTFIDPLCRNYCPIEAQRLNDVVNTLPVGSKPAIVAVSVNVYGNAHSILMEDAQKWKLVPQWQWAIGQPSALSRVWSAYHVEVLATTKKLAGVTVRTIAHTEGAYLIDAKGYERALFLWPYRASGVVQMLRALTS